MDAAEVEVIRPNQVMAALGISKPTLTRWRRRGWIPQPRRIGPHAIGWPKQELAQWLSARAKVA
jgi:predicted DNA-binding transcriptional regulator AlpA